MIWTIMPEEIVMEGFDLKREYRYQHYLGRSVIVEAMENGKGKIIQLLSTDPNDYLNQQFAPGKEITLD